MNEPATIRATREPVVKLQIRDVALALSIAESITLRDRLTTLLAEHHAGIIGVIREIVSREFGISVQKLDSPERTDNVCRARHAAFWLCRQYGFTLNQIGRAFNRDHGSVMHGCSVFIERMDTSRDLQRAGVYLVELVDKALAASSVVLAATHRAKRVC